MNVVGIDVSKETLVGVVMNRSMHRIDSFTIPNTKDAIDKQLTTLQNKYAHIIAACEATAEYHHMLATVCLERIICLRLLNPITTKQFTRATVRKRKTDMSDAEIIAKLGLQGEGNIVTGDLLEARKPIERTACKLVQIQQQLLLMEKRLERAVTADPQVAQELTQCREQLGKAVKVLRQKAYQRTRKEIVTLLSSIPGTG